MGNPETQTPTPEAEQEKVVTAENPLRSLDDIRAEHDANKSLQEARAETENAEHNKMEETAEQMLENEMMRQTYREMVTALEGDSKEVFASIDASLSDQEKIDLAKLFNGFMEVAEQEKAAMLYNVHHIPKNESLQKFRLARSGKTCDCFQRSLDRIVEKTQGIKKEEPKSDPERLGEAVNKAANAAFDEKITPAEGLVWSKIKSGVRSYVTAEKEANPQRVFRKKEEPSVASAGSSGSSSNIPNSRLDAAADMYEMRNLFEEIRDAKEVGINIVVRNEKGDEVTDPQSIARDPRVRIEVVKGGNLTPEEVKACASNLVLVTEDSRHQLYEGNAWQTLTAIERMESAVTEKKSSSS